ncbi:MAG TPA: signal peptidase I [Candidatus Kapabacteria bacterium]|nr:signal peptidase I [Candidatus Kapabacteria bacterium]
MNKPTPKKNGTTSATEQNRSYKFISELLYILVVVLLVKTCVAGPYRIPSGSMEKTLLVGDYLFVNQFVYGVKTPPNIPLTDIRLPRVTLFPAMHDPKGGDIVVFVYPGDRDQAQADEMKYLVKRCVGTPGDTIVVRNKDLYVDGKVFPKPAGMQFINPSPIPKENYYPNIFPPGMRWNPDNYGPLRVPKKGDVVSLNAGNFPQWATFIEREGHTAELQGSTVMVDGKPAASYTVAHDYYFMMGDNRDNSEDSRYWGFVPDDNIVGQPMFLYWSWNQDIPITDIFKKLASVRWNRIGRLVE